jgi:hypothetical protein
MGEEIGELWNVGTGTLKRHKRVSLGEQDGIGTQSGDLGLY